MSLIRISHAGSRSLLYLLLFGILPVLMAQPALVVTQSPHTPAAKPKDILDAAYPAGTRLATIKAPYAADHVQVLSAGLVAAGSPVMTYDGQHVLFAGKASAESAWQIYEVRHGGGTPRALTSIPGGAMHPAVLPDGSIVFASPVPMNPPNASKPPQIFVQSNGGKPRQITFTASGATHPTVLLDGRILFVSAQPSAHTSAVAGSALYTINNDGTEITAFAGQHDQPALLYQPRQLNDKRVVFLASSLDAGLADAAAEFVRMARPFASRSVLLPDSRAHMRSVQPLGASNLLVCAQMAAGPGDANGSWVCFSVSADAKTLGNPLFADRAWNTLEAIEMAAPARPMGRLSNMDPAKSTGQILCLDVNDSTLRAAGQPVPKATSVRLLTATAGGNPRVLGEVPVQADGSFMAEVPADTLLGFEALDGQGQVLRREAPSIWVRAGENRACVGCHAAHNRAPHNQRPLAVRVPVHKFCEPPPSQTLAHKSK